MTKKLLSIQYPPFSHPDFGKLHFGALGFNVYRCDIGSYSHLEHTELLVKRDHNMNLDDFDAVLIINSDIDEPFDEKLLFPEKEVLELKNRLKLISKEKAKDILFFGMNASVPEEFYEQQSNLFDGLFISKATPPLIWQEILSKLHSFAIDQ